MPVSMVEEFHSQFKLKTNGFRDNNNFLVYNKVETMDSRLLNLVSTKYKFVDMESKPAWTADSPQVERRNVTLDGINYHTETIS